MDLANRKSLVKSLSQSYSTASWKTRNQIIDQLVLVTGYRRDYASYLLLHPPSSLKQESQDW